MHDQLLPHGVELAWLLNPRFIPAERVGLSVSARVSIYRWRTRTIEGPRLQVFFVISHIEAFEAIQL